MQQVVTDSGPYFEPLECTLKLKVLTDFFCDDLNDYLQSWLSLSMNKKVEVL